MAINPNDSITLNDILGQFAVPKKNYTFTPLTSGLINDTFLVSESKRPLYVLQRINHLVFENVAGLMDNYTRALRQLSATDYQSIDVINTTDGMTYYEYLNTDTSYWRLVSYIKDTLTFDTTKSDRIAFEAGKIIARFHTLLQDSDTQSYVDTIPQFHSLALRQNQFRQVLKSADSAKLKIATKAISFAKETLGELSKMDIDSLPTRICHNDTKLNNILFSTETDSALCLIDLDTLMTGHFLYDFGDAVRTIVNTAPEDEQDHSKITFKENLFEAFAKGLASIDPFLSKAEIDSLPTGAVLMPFLHGIRALTDYLDNDRYYKVTYKNQNLDRAQSLFCFAKKSKGKLDYMQKIVTKELTVAI